MKMRGGAGVLFAALLINAATLITLVQAMPCNNDAATLINALAVASALNASKSITHQRILASDAALNPSKYPECSDALCLVQAILNRRPFIYITTDIDLQGVGILPTIEYEATIIGLCDTRRKCVLDAKHQSGIFVVGLGGYLSLKDLELSGGFCSEGPAVLVSGLGAHSPASGGKLEARNVRFINNIAMDVGGAVSVQGGASVYVANSMFYNNKAVKKGGAIYLGGSSKTLNHVNATPGLPQPSAHQCSYRTCATFTNTEFNTNVAENVGGAIYVDDATADCADVGGAQLDVSTCTFLNNTAVQNGGGAIFLAFKSAGAYASVKNTAFLNNTAAVDGGDVDLEAGNVGGIGPVLDAYGTVFAYSSAQYGQSICAHSGSKASFTKCDFSAFAKDSALLCKDNNCNNTCPVHPGQHDPTCANVAAPNQFCPWTPPDCPTTQDSSASTPPPPATVTAPAPADSDNNSSKKPPRTSDSGSGHSQAFPAAPTPKSTGSGAISPPVKKPHNPPRGSGGIQGLPVNPDAQAPQPAGSHHNHHDAPPAPEDAPIRNKTKRSPPRGIGNVASAPPSPPSKSDDVLPSVAGGSITGDPHFLGKHGEKYDFQGKDGLDYCVVSDKSLHINMHVFHGRIRNANFIGKLGMLYKGHTVLIDAQSPIASFRNLSEVTYNGDWWSVIIDNDELSSSHKVDHVTSLKLEGTSLTITKTAQYAHIYAPDEVDIVAYMVPATFGRHGSLKNYINLEVSNLKTSPEVNGLLGQTFKDDAHAFDKMHRAKHIRRSRAGNVVLDGTEGDYVSSNILAPDCRFSVFDTKLQKKLESENTHPHDDHETRKGLFRQEVSEIDVSQQQPLLISHSCVGFGDQSLCGGH